MLEVEPDVDHFESGSSIKVAEEHTMNSGHKNCSSLMMILNRVMGVIKRYHTLQYEETCQPSSLAGSPCRAPVSNMMVTKGNFVDDAVNFAEALIVLLMALEALHGDAKLPVLKFF